MKLKKITEWLDATLNVAAFDDVSNNGLQVARSAAADEVKTVAFAVDASLRTVQAAAEAGAELLVVHHGISWGGGIRRLDGGVYEVVKAALSADLAIYACHLPLDAHPDLGNNAQLAAMMGLQRRRPAFSYHGNVIGFTGTTSRRRLAAGLAARFPEARGLWEPALTKGPERLTVGVCSGGAGDFAEEAQRLGCDLFVTGEASWGDVIAAENCGMPMLCLGHYETEVWGVRAVSAAMDAALKVRTRDLTEDLRRL